MHFLFIYLLDTIQTHNSLEKFKRANSGYMLCDIQGSKNPYYHAITTEGREL